MKKLVQWQLCHKLHHRFRGSAKNKSLAELEQRVLEHTIRSKSKSKGCHDDCLQRTTTSTQMGGR